MVCASFSTNISQLLLSGRSSDVWIKWYKDCAYIDLVLGNEDIEVFCLAFHFPSKNDLQLENSFQ